MKTCDIDIFLRNNPYPGRGIILGHSGDGARSILVYFIMGRSENSRNRIFEKTQDGIRTKAFDPSKLTDPSLVIYHPVRVFNKRVIVTNGEQTDTLLQCLQDGQGFRDALLKWDFEPDPPIYTPRVSGLVEPDGSYRLSIIKTAGGDPSCCCRYFFEYTTPIPGYGHFISTYMTDGDPPPSFEGEPVPVRILDSGGLKGFAQNVWEALNEYNKVSLYAREVVLATGQFKELIINRNT